MNASTGKVYLVGAGPGDPGLLTLRGKELLERANVVVYDGLVNDDLLKLAPQAESIFVGKRPDSHTLTQADIDRILVEQAQHHACIVRLKGGDPLVFGRGGEEAGILASHGVAFEIVPGVTAGIAVPAYAGIPVTYRGISSSVTLVTGRLDPNKEDDPIKLERLHLEGTLAIYMGLRTMADITAELIRIGRAPDTPAAAIQWGTLEKQRTVTAPLNAIHEACAREGLESPMLLIVGEVVSLRETLSWFESRPLFGKRVAVTRARRRAADLVHRLRELGADVFEFPTVQIEAITPAESFSVEGYNWILLTSVNGVDILFDRMQENGLDARALHSVRLCAIGSKTAEAVQERFLRVDAQPKHHEPAEVIALIRAQSGQIEGLNILLPRADIAKSVIPAALREHGAEVTELSAYRANTPDDADTLADALCAYAPDFITFNSASAARNFHAIMGVERLKQIEARAAYAAIGPIAANAARDLGLLVNIVPETHRVHDLVSAIVHWNANRR